MPSDRSRSLIEREELGYHAVVAQQGRVILDRDFNAEMMAAECRTIEDARDIIGPSGTPDDGFAIALPTGSPTYWQPPAGRLPEAVGHGRDLTVSPGTMYLGGVRVALPGLQAEQAITYSYLDQPDWIAPDSNDANSTSELVYLEITEQEVSAVEDPDLLEVALGGPDTTQRLRYMRRIRRLAVDADTCATAWQQAVSGWADQGLAFDARTMRLRPLSRMLVGFENDAARTDPCDPIATGGYLGADNQLIRVRVGSGVRQSLSLVWGYDNASFLYRVAEISADGTRLKLAADPPDAAHQPMTGQVVELIRAGAILGLAPGASDPSDPPDTTQIIRAVAELSGTFHTLARPYGPVTSGDPTRYIVLDEAIDPNDDDVASTPLFLRVWQAELPFDLDEAVTLTDPASGTSTGVTVTISTIDGAAVADAAAWEIAVRPSTPQAVYPETLIQAPQPPDAPRRWVCPLALVDWRADGGPTVSDCREHFDNLVTLTKRKAGGCCTIQYKPADVDNGASLQAAIDRAVLLADRVTVCLTPGTYTLPSTLRIGRSHLGLTIESCGGDVLIVADTGAAPADFIDGLIAITETAKIRLQGLTLVPAFFALTPQVRGELLRRVITTFDRSTIEDIGRFLRNPQASFGIRACDAISLTIERCTIRFARPGEEAQAGDRFNAAVFLQGRCTGFVTRDCTLQGSVQPTYTPVPVPEINQRAADTEAAATTTTTTATTTTKTKTRAATSRMLRETIFAAGTLFNAEAGQRPEEKAALLTERVNGTLAAFVAQRLASPLATAGSALVTGAGILAADYVGTAVATEQRAKADATGVADGNTAADDNDDAVDCVIGEAEIRDTMISEFCFGTLLMADFGTLRIEANRIANSTAGLWLQRADFAFPAKSQAEETRYQRAFFYFEEYLLLYALAAVIPPPEDVSRGSAIFRVAGSSFLASPLSVDTTLFVRDNDIVTTLTADRETPVATTSLFIGLSPLRMPPTFNHVSGTQLANQPPAFVSLLLTANRVRGSNSHMPAALITLPYQQPTTITGNVVIGGNVEATALLVLVENAEKILSHVAISGNALSGNSNLRHLQRGGAEQRAGWSPLNADQT